MPLLFQNQNVYMFLNLFFVSVYGFGEFSGTEQDEKKKHEKK